MTTARATITTMEMAPILRTEAAPIRAVRRRPTGMGGNPDMLPPPLAMILIAVLIAIFLVLALNLLIWFWRMGGGMMGMGNMINMMGTHGQMTDQMIQSCIGMMQNTPRP